MYISGTPKERPKGIEHNKFRNMVKIKKQINKFFHVSSLHNLLNAEFSSTAECMEGIMRGAVMGPKNYSYPLNGISPNEVLSDFLMEIKISLPHLLDSHFTFHRLRDENFFFFLLTDIDFFSFVFLS